MATKRIGWIDCLKGIGILSVIFVHVTGIKAMFIYALPLFFLLSGYLYHPQPKSKFVIKLVKRIGLPYMVFLLILSLMVYRTDILKMGGVILFGGVKLKGAMGVFWFPPVLLFSLWIYNGIGGYRYSKWLCVSMFLVAQFPYFKNIFLPLNIQSLPLALFYISVGNLTRTYMPLQSLQDVVNRMKRKKLFMVVLFVLYSSMLCIHGLYLDIKYNYYGIPVLSIVASVFVVFLLALFCAMLMEMKCLLKPVAYCGRGSLFIMFVHQCIHFWVFSGQGMVFTLIGTVAISLILYHLAASNYYTRRLLCGEI